MKKRTITVSRVTEVLLIQNVYEQIVDDGFVPDYVVAIASGGLTIGRRLKNLFDVPIAVMMAESYSSKREIKKDIKFARHVVYMAPLSGKVLLVDDLPDTGRTLEESISYLTHKFHGGFWRNLWRKIRGKNSYQGIDEIRTATIWYKEESSVKPDYYAMTVGADAELDFDGHAPWIEQPDEVKEPFPKNGYYYKEDDEQK